MAPTRMMRDAVGRAASAPSETPGPYARHRSGVVVGVDNSDGAVRTALWAAGHAVQQRLPLVVVHCCPAATTHPLGELLRIASRVGSEFPNLDAHFEVRTGDPVDILAEMSQRAGVVVIGAAGLDAHDPTGSVPDRLVVRSRSPVLVITDEGPVEWSVGVAQPAHPTR